MIRKLKRAVVRATWWVLPILGCTVNELLGGRTATGLVGSYEARKPEEWP